MEKLKEKLLSRKFWMSAIPIIVGIAEILGADGGAVELICGALLAVVPAVFYVVTEGRIDAARKSELTDAAKELIGKSE